MKLAVQQSSALYLTCWESLVESGSGLLLLYIKALCSGVNLYPLVQGVSDWAIRFCVPLPPTYLAPSLNYHHVDSAAAPLECSRPLSLIEA